MHAASVILLSWAMIGAACFFSQAMAGFTAGLLALLVAVVGLPHGAATAIWIMARSAGWVAHVLEQRAQGFMMRPRARYIV